MRTRRLPAPPFLLPTLLLGAVGIGTVAFLGGTASPEGAVADGPCSATTGGPKLNGVSFVAPPRPVGPDALAPLGRVGAGWVGVLPYAFLEPDGEVRFDRERQWWGERTEGVAATVGFARIQGLRVMLKPHLWGRGMEWVGDFVPASDAAWRRWEDSYRDYLLTFTDLAETLGVELLVVGTELDATVRARPEYWRALIAEVRARYGGELTYAANWDGVHDVPFWDLLDYIGVDAYYPLSPSSTPSVEELRAAWVPIVAELAELCREHGVPVLFPEFGYRSIDAAAGAQWELPSERERGVPANHRAQANAYEALFRSWWSEPWFAGGFLWKWFPDDGARQPGAGADYTPQHKPVEAVIRRWYEEGTTQREAPPPGG